MSDLRILIVEDDDTAYNGYQDWVDEDFDDANIQITLVRAKTQKEATSVLKSQEIQGAIVDLNLYEERVDTPSGNSVIQQIMEEFKIPVVVASGNIGNLDREFSSRNSAFFKVFTRDEDNADIFEPIISVFKTGLFNVIGAKGKIEQSLHKVFWDHIAHDVDDWFNCTGDSEKSILRYTLNHLKAYFEKGVHTFHGAEVYIKPPIIDHISSGDIIVNLETKKRFILLSPACDVAVRESTDEGIKINASSLVLCEVSSVNPESFLETGLINTISKGNFKGVIKKAVEGTDLRTFYLPQYKNLEAGVLDFRNISTITLNDFFKHQRLATVSESFFKNIQSNFSSYYARQGQPDLDKKNIIQDAVDKFDWDSYIQN